MQSLDQNNWKAFKKDKIVSPTHPVQKEKNNKQIRTLIIKMKPCKYWKKTGEFF